MSLLQKGSKGAEVQALQTLLNSTLGLTLKADGDFGGLTERAIRNFQASVGIPTTGQADDLTMAKLKDQAQAPLITVQQLISIVPMPAARAAQFAPALDAAMKEYEINTPIRIAMFLANVATESSSFASMVENLNYSAIGLSNAWPSRYGVGGKRGVPNELANRIARQPEVIANITYADRMGNGPASSGDGWRYRGRSPAQITGLDNYIAAGKELKLDLVNCPELLEQPTAGCRAAAHFWKSNGINVYADKGDFDGACDKVNIGKKTEKQGDALGFVHRQAFYVKARPVLGLK